MADLNTIPTPVSPALAALAERGFIDQMSDPAAIDEALAKGPVTFYSGFDPTATSLHAGHLLPIMAMRMLQRFGHMPIVLLGGATARVGDPSGRTEARKMLDEEALARNVEGIRRQFGRFLSYDESKPNAARVLNNAEWLQPIHYIDFLRDIGSHFTVNRMIATKTYRERLDNEQPLSFLEFNYQLLQAYDFLHLYKSANCTLQVGGSDQWGNMVAGVELVRRIERGSTQCLTFPLLTTADGRKMGKSERGALYLDPELVPPFDYYQYWISVDDRDVQKLLLLFTDLEVGEIKEMSAAEGAALNDVKRRLAYEATKIAHGEEEAARAQTASAQAFSDSDDWSAVPSVELPEASIKLMDLVVDERIGAFRSKREARQRIESGAVRVDGEVCKDPFFELQGSNASDRTFRLQAGKKNRVRVVLTG